MAIIKKKTSLQTSTASASAVLEPLCSRRWSSSATVGVCLVSLFLLYLMNHVSTTKTNPSSYLLGTGSTASTGGGSSSYSSSVLRSTLGTTSNSVIEEQRTTNRLPPPTLDPQIRLVPLQAFHPCDDTDEKKGTILPLHVSCLTTILVESEEAIQVFERAIPSNNNNNNNNPHLLSLLCRDFKAAGHEEAVLLTCLQTPDRLGALVRVSEKKDEYSPVFPSEASTIVSAVLQESDENHHSHEHAQHVRIIPRTTAVMHGYYPPRSPAHDAYRGMDDNSGNFLWSFGATRMFNPATTLLLWDAEYYKLLSLAKKTEVVPGKGVLATATPVVSAYIIATANALNLEKPGVHTALLNAYYARMQAFQNVPVMVMGLGMQATFEFIDNATSTTATSSSTTRKTAAVWQKDPGQPALTGDPVYEAVTGKIHLYDDQLRVLSKMQQLQRPGLKGIGVRGELTRVVCSNSGIDNCIATGCPTLLVSRHANLGMQLAQKWQVLQQELSGESRQRRKQRSLKIALTLPAINNVASDAADYKLLANLLLRIAQSSVLGHQSPQHEVVFNIQAPYDEPRLANFMKSASGKDDSIIQPILKSGNKIIFKKYNNAEEWLADSAQMDLVLSTRIHGSMVGIATAVPTVVIPTDHRIQELVDSMYLPHLTMSDVAAAISNATTTSGNDDVNVLLLEILKRARYQDFDHFERNRRNKMRQWHDMISATGLEMDPALVKILKSSSSSS